MTDVVDIINGYEAWKAEQAFQDSDALNYQRHLEVQKELRILRALRHCIVRDNATTAFLYKLINDDEDALAQVEATYEA